jgi:hypothetical protein
MVIAGVVNKLFNFFTDFLGGEVWSPELMRERGRKKQHHAAGTGALINPAASIGKAWC